MGDRAEGRKRPGRHASETGFDPEGTGETRRDADRTAAIGAERQRTEARGECGRGAAGRPARRLVQVPWIARDTGKRRIRRPLPAEFRRRGLADQDRPRFPAAALRPARRHATDRRRRSVSEPRRVGQPLVSRRSFTATGTPSSGDKGSPAIQRASDSSAICIVAAASITQKALTFASKRFDAAETGLRHLERREFSGLECVRKLGRSHLMRFFGHLPPLPAIRLPSPS